jgi:hypothetical protein
VNAWPGQCIANRAAINTMKVKPPPGELHGVFLCMNNYRNNCNDDSNSNDTKP